MADLDEDGRTFRAGERTVVAHMRATDPGASRVAAVLVAEDAIEDEDFLSAHVGVRIEARLGL